MTRILLMISDQDKAADFYTKVLGFKKNQDAPTPNGPRFLTVGLPEQDFHLVFWPGTPGKAEPVYGRSPATCTIEVPDIRKAFEELKAKVVQFETEVLEYPWGWVAVFLDLDGNRLQVRHGR
jgi:predicted enzyme related to lactoylglutathione lyase